MVGCYMLETVCQSYWTWC